MCETTHFSGDAHINVALLLRIIPEKTKVATLCGKQMTPKHLVSVNPTCDKCRETYLKNDKRY